MGNALMPMTAGIEVEFNGLTDSVAAALDVEGWCDATRHDYHCRCATCAYATGLLWRYQRDSTVAGEFITRILGDWPTMTLAAEKLDTAIQTANENIERQMGPLANPNPYTVVVAQNTGLHVHVKGDGHCDWDQLVRTYLRYERWLQHLGAGPFPDKRDGMNMTALNALRQQMQQLGEPARAGRRVSWGNASNRIARQIAEDRHVDLNYSQRARTFEYRVFNATTAAWQMELATRLAVGFTTWAANDYPGTESLILPQPALATLKPPIPIGQFAECLGSNDPRLGELLARKLADSGDPVEPDVPDVEPEPEPEPLQVPYRGDIHMAPAESYTNNDRMLAAGFRWNARLYQWVPAAASEPDRFPRIQPARDIWDPLDDDEDYGDSPDDEDDD